MKSSFHHQNSALTKGLTDPLRGRIRARKDASDCSFYSGSGSDIDATGDASPPSLAGQSEQGSFADRDNENYHEEESDPGLSSQAPHKEVTSISFGALVKAQASLNTRNRSNDAYSYEKGHESPKLKQAPCDFINDEALERGAGKKDTRDFLRTSKHAPAQSSSKKAVSRRRYVVPSQKFNHRDPRFEPFSGAVDEQKVKKDYSFLDTYRDSEILELKSAIRKTKDSDDKEKLKRALLSMKSRNKAQKMKEQQQEVLRKHKKEEKGKIEQGKRPFYLKKADQKRMALIKRFEGMKGKQVDKVIERRRKKKTARERKGMPNTRRNVL